MRVPDCMIDCEPGVSLSPEQRGAIALALRHMTVAYEVADELRVIAPLHEGLSGAQVFQAELRFSSGQSRAVIVKLDAVERLTDELTAANLCATATNVARMLAPATADGFTHIVAIVYMHAAESWTGPLRTLEAIVRESLADRVALAASLRLLGRVLVALSSQVHKLDIRKMSRLSERDYYIQRWLCNATVRVDRAGATPVSRSRVHRL